MLAPIKARQRACYGYSVTSPQLRARSHEEARVIRRRRTARATELGFPQAAMRNNTVAQGSWIAIAAAVLFGLTTPLVKHFGEHAGPFATATLLYLGAAVGAVGRRHAGERAPGLAEAPRLLLVATFGAALAPAALAWGLQRSGALTGSLLLNLEALFTIALAAAIYREPIGRRIMLACALMVAGGGVLALRLGGGGASSLLGIAALIVATLSWALDNTLTRPLSDFEPRATVFWKAMVGSALSASVALSFRDGWPGATATLGLLACGASGYGLSLRLYLRAQRLLGAARTGSLFALAPFCGAAAAFVGGDQHGAALIALAACLFGVAAYLHVTEHHAHRHGHETLDHEHAHTHDDGHHHHTHNPPVAGSHTHPHHHDTLEHEHAHAADLHHRHEHD
jgi:drug/metabolite transporter (DMT)-like permease